VFLISGLSPGHCFVPFAQALLHLAVLGAWSPTLESVLRALMTVLLAKASIRSCDGRHSHSPLCQLWFSELVIGVAPASIDLGRAHARFPPVLSMSLQPCCIETGAVTRLPPHQAPTAWGKTLVDRFRMCSAARAHNTSTMQRSQHKGVARACEKAEELQQNADRCWTASERIRAANVDAVRRANVTVGDIRKLSVNIDITEGTNPTENSWINHRAEHESMATGSCSVKCNIRKDKAWPDVPASWAHIRTGDTWGSTVGGAQVRASMSQECCRFENSDALHRIGLLMSFVDRADVHSSYFPIHWNWPKRLGTETGGANDEQTDDATPRSRMGTPMLVKSSSLPVERGHSALFVSTFCQRSERRRVAERTSRLSQCPCQQCQRFR